MNILKNDFILFATDNDENFIQELLDFECESEKINIKELKKNIFYITHSCLETINYKGEISKCYQLDEHFMFFKKEKILLLFGCDSYYAISDISEKTTIKLKQIDLFETWTKKIVYFPSSIKVIGLSFEQEGYFEITKEEVNPKSIDSFQDIQEVYLKIHSINFKISRNNEIIFLDEPSQGQLEYSISEIIDMVNDNKFLQCSKRIPLYK